jgi:succinate dehydrogenase / fumarate reductase iron-sulfur subunit
MAENKWTVNFEIYRQKGQEAPKFDTFALEVRPDEYVVDAVERIWAFHDRTLTYRHACHHSTCGACGMRVNGVEKLTCITPIQSVTRNGGTVRIEPLRNFPLVSDLVVDMSKMYTRMEQVGFRTTVPLNEVPPEDSKGIQRDRGASTELERLVDCIECGMCISACPVPLTTPDYLGPAVLAGAQHRGLDHSSADVLALVDSSDGVWRCHSAYECTAVCPSNVEPAWRIMDLRKQVVKERFKRIYG